MLQNHLTEQLGRLPSVAVLATTNAFIASIADAISEDRQLPNGRGLPAVDHELLWDQGVTAAAGYVVASILEWPTLAREDAILETLCTIADYYRVKLANGTVSARAIITATENCITAFSEGRLPRANTGKVIVAAYDAGLQLTGNPVIDWQIARARLHGTPQLEDIYGMARLLRLLRATDALAWGLNGIWDGEASYPGAADTVRRILSDELINGRATEPHPVTLMNMHKSKGKEFDGVIIAEGVHHAKLLDTSWDPQRIIRQRRLLRVAMTRARHAVVFVRPNGASPLVPAS
jgi:DNA helicase-2/ATP-dependent DNA helicase PcrA